MWNPDSTEILNRTLRQERLRRAEIYWELERSRTLALRTPKAVPWKLGAFFRRWTLKLSKNA